MKLSQNHNLIVAERDRLVAMTTTFSVVTKPSLKPTNSV